MMRKKSKNDQNENDLFRGVVVLSFVVLVGCLAYVVYAKAGFNFMGPK